MNKIDFGKKISKDFKIPDNSEKIIDLRMKIGDEVSFSNPKTVSLNPGIYDILFKEHPWPVSFRHENESGPLHNIIGIKRVE